MRMFLDDQPRTYQASTVGEAIAACSAEAEEQGRCVVEVIVDGAAWGNEQLAETDLTTATAEEVRMISAQPAELVSQTFGDAVTALEDAKSLQDDAAALLQADDSSAAMDRLSEALTIWSSVQQAVVQGSQLVGLDLDQCNVNSRSVQDYVVALSQRLEALISQLEQNDLAGVADTLLYELPDVVDQWRDMLTSLQQIIQDA